MTGPANQWELSTGAQSVARWARETPHATAIVEADRHYSYTDLAFLIVRTTKYLRASGVAGGAVVGIECSSYFMHLVLILACECLGITTVSLVSPELTADSEVLPRCAVLYIEAVNDAVRELPNVVPITIGLVETLARTPVTEADFEVLEFQPQPDSGGRIVKTSGTTGRQKFMCNDCNSIQLGVQITRYMLDTLGGSYDFLSLYPFTFRPSYIDAILALRFGRTVIFSTMTDFFRDLAVLGDAHTVLLPADAVALCAAFNRPDAAGTKCAVQINGGSLAPSLRRDLLDTFATVVCNTYSTNETNYIALVGADGVGTLLPDAEIRILGDDGRDMKPGESGLVAVRSPRMVPNYLWNEALSAKHFVDGWHITGDLGHCPNPRQLVVTGRADDMLNIGGVKVPPQPIEADIKTIPGIIDAVLLSIEDSQGASELHVVIERPNADRDIELDRLIRPIVHRSGRDFVAHYRDTLPRTQTGKVQRGVLRTAIEGSGQTAAPTRSGQKRANGEAATTDRTDC